MIVNKSIIKLPVSFSFIRSILDCSACEEELLFFDIETTGFAADSSYLYLIGCIYMDDGSATLCQWFSQGIEDECSILEAFLSHAEKYKALLHYNGTGFDLPYLSKKCTQFNLPDVLSRLDSIDIYKLLKPWKVSFGLSSLKQKNIEQFLGINRKDMFDGGELIAVYTEYVAAHKYNALRSGKQGNECTVPSRSGLPVMKTRDERTLLYTLLLHNFEDVKGMLSICTLLIVSRFCDGGFKILSATNQKENDLEYLQVNIEAILNGVFPCDIKNQALTHDIIFELNNDINIYLYISGITCRLLIPLIEDELKFFIEEYKDYYYLPDEDKAIHKSLAQFVDKDHRIKAKADTCYIKKHSIFLPQPDTVYMPAFKVNRKDKLSFFEASLFTANDEADSYDRQLRYISTIMKKSRYT